MSKIDTSDWKEFRLGDLFDIHPTKAYKMNNAELFDTLGNTPVLSNSSIDNGIGGRSGLAPTEDGNVITFSDTTTGADTMFYQKEPFIGYAHVQGMYPIGFELNEEIAMFFISIMRAAFSQDFNYANKFNRSIVMDTTVLLPVKETEEIDYEYMEERIRELEEERIRELDAYLNVAHLEDDMLSEKEKVFLDDAHQKQSKCFKIEDLFKVEGAKKRFNANAVSIFDKRVDTAHPYIVRTSEASDD